MRPNSPEMQAPLNQIHSYSDLEALERDGSVLIARGDGVYVEDNRGRRYLEAMSGLWCANLGFSEKRLADAAYRQASTLGFYHNFFGRSSDTAARLAEMLVEITPNHLRHVIFCNSGSEANDTAIKLIWYYNNALGRPKKKKILSRQQGYHGVTVATASLTGLPINHMAFDLPIAGISHLSCPHYPNLAKPGETEEEFSTRLAGELEQHILAEGPDTIAAMFAEPVMAAGGVILPPETYFEKIQNVLRKYEILLVADEVVCGFGRTGAMFGSQRYGILPDFMTLAKGLSAAAAPISALVTTDEVYDVIKRQSAELGGFGHGYTYSGHPVSAAVAVETLNIYQERDILAHVGLVSEGFLSRLHGLAEHPLVAATRGVGLIGAFDLIEPSSAEKPSAITDRFKSIAFENGLIVRTRMNTVALCPPLIISEQEVTEIFDKIEHVLEKVASVRQAGAAGI